MTRTARQEVWLALSDLFLDADVSLQHDHIMQTLMASPFDLKTLDTIFIEEVYPVCIANLHQVAGEWTGFEEGHLFEQVAQYQGRRPSLRKLTRHLRWRHTRKMVPEWFKLRAALVAQGKR